MNVVENGLSDLKAQTDTIGTAWEQAKASGGNQFGTELDAFDTAVDALGATLTTGTSDGKSVSSELSHCDLGTNA
ncbi:MAG: hypothetical protein ACRDH7_16955 [Actinomycetota bacterium]